MNKLSFKKQNTMGSVVSVKKLAVKDQNLRIAKQGSGSESESVDLSQVEEGSEKIEDEVIMIGSQKFHRSGSFKVEITEKLQSAINFDAILEASVSSTTRNQNQQKREKKVYALKSPSEDSDISSKERQEIKNEKNQQKSVEQDKTEEEYCKSESVIFKIQNHNISEKSLNQDLQSNEQNPHNQQIQEIVQKAENQFIKIQQIIENSKKQLLDFRNQQDFAQQKQDYKFDKLNQKIQEKQNKQSEQLQGQSDRILICEKMLNFGKMYQPKKDMLEHEIKCEEQINNIFDPTHKRVIDLQEQCGKIAKMFADSDKKLGWQIKEIQEALNLSAGNRLKDQIERGFQQRLDNLNNRLDSKIYEFKGDIGSFKRKNEQIVTHIDHWKEVSKANKTNMEKFKEQYKEDGQAIYLNMDRQLQTIKSMFVDQKKQMAKVYQKIEDHKDGFDSKLSIIHEFKKSIQNNHFLIEKIDKKVEENKCQIQSFKNEKLYTESKDNYTKLYTELAEQRNIIEYEFKPQIEETRIDKKAFVKIQQYFKMQKESYKTNQKLMELNKELNKLRDDRDAMKAKLKELETSSPSAAMRRRQSVLNEQMPTSNAIKDLKLSQQRKNQKPSLRLNQETTLFKKNPEVAEIENIAATPKEEEPKHTTPNYAKELQQERLSAGKIKVNFTDYTKFRKMKIENPITEEKQTPENYGPCKHKECAFQPEEFDKWQKQLNQQLEAKFDDLNSKMNEFEDNYLSMTDASMVILDTTEPFFDATEQQLQNNIDLSVSVLENKLLEAKSSIIQQQNLQQSQFQKFITDKAEQQDQVIDLISCEIGRDSKNKSDLMIDTEFIKKKIQIMNNDQEKKYDFFQARMIRSQQGLNDHNEIQDKKMTKISEDLDQVISILEKQAQLHNQHELFQFPRSSEVENSQIKLQLQTGIQSLFGLKQKPKPPSNRTTQKTSCKASRQQSVLSESNEEVEFSDAQNKILNSLGNKKVMINTNLNTILENHDKSANPTPQNSYANQNFIEYQPVHQRNSSNKDLSPVGIQAQKEKQLGKKIDMIRYIRQQNQNIYASKQEHNESDQKQDELSNQIFKTMSQGIQSLHTAISRNKEFKNSGLSHRQPSKKGKIESFDKILSSKSAKSGCFTQRHGRNENIKTEEDLPTQSDEAASFLKQLRVDIKNENVEQNPKIRSLSSARIMKRQSVRHRQSITRRTLFGL